MANFEEIIQFVVAGNEAKVKELVREMIDAGVKPLDIINQGLIAGMNIVGPKFKNGEMYVPEVLMSGRAMSTGIEIIKPYIADKDVPSIGKVVLGSVEGDLHDIGKNLVGLMLESAGFTLINLGVDVSAEKFVQSVKELNPDIVAMSALLTTTMLSMKDTIDQLKVEGLRNQVKVIVGGAPLSPEFANEIGADGYASDGASAVDLCKELLPKKEVKQC